MAATSTNSTIARLGDIPDDDDEIKRAYRLGFECFTTLYGDIEAKRKKIEESEVILQQRESVLKDREKALKESTGALKESRKQIAELEWAAKLTESKHKTDLKKQEEIFQQEIQKLQQQVDLKKTEKHTLESRLTYQFYALKNSYEKSEKLREKLSQAKKDKKDCEETKKGLEEKVKQMESQLLEQASNLEEYNKQFEEENRLRLNTDVHLYKALELVRHIGHECQTKILMLDETYLPEPISMGVEADLLSCRKSFKKLCAMQNERFEKWSAQMGVFNAFREDFMKSKRAFVPSSMKTPIHTTSFDSTVFGGVWDFEDGSTGTGVGLGPQETLEADEVHPDMSRSSNPSTLELGGVDSQKKPSAGMKTMAALQERQNPGITKIEITAEIDSHCSSLPLPEPLATSSFSTEPRVYFVGNRSERSDPASYILDEYINNKINEELGQRKTSGRARKRANASQSQQPGSSKFKDRKRSDDNSFQRKKPKTNPSCAEA